MICETCKQQFHPGDLRPYGPGGSMICHPCGVHPDRVAETDRRMAAMITGGSCIIDENGIRRATSEEVLDAIVPNRAARRAANRKRMN